LKRVLLGGVFCGHWNDPQGVSLVL